METSNQINACDSGFCNTTHLVPVVPHLSQEYMIAADESRKEVCRRRNVFAKPKVKKRIGYWNVRTLHGDGKIEQLVKEAKRYKLSVLGVSEMRWSGSGKKMIDGNEMVLYYSGLDDNSHQSGVGILLDKETSKCVLDWKPINDRIITLRLNSKHIKTSIIQVYAPQNKLPDESKDEFYNTLQEVFENIPRHDMICVMGDFNAKIGLKEEGEEKVVGRYVLPAERSDNGDRFVDFCKQNDLAITSTMFNHPDIHKYTWLSPDGVTKNQIDHFAVNGKFRSSVCNTRYYRGADIFSDHNLGIADIQLKLCKVRKTRGTTQKRYDFHKLKSPEIKQQYNIELRNRFEVLTGLNEQDASSTCENMWTFIKQTYNQTTEEVIGLKKKNSKDWVSGDSWAKINQRRDIKIKRDSARSQRLRRKLQKEYATQDKIVKKCVRRDKRKWVENIAIKAETAASIGNMKAVYDATRLLAGEKMRKSDTLKDKGGNKLTREEDIRNRWKEHFEEVLNRPEPQRKLDIPSINSENSEIETNCPSKVEIKDAINKTRAGQSGPIDGVVPEMLKSDIDTSVDVLHKMFCKVWDEENVPGDWTRGLISKIPKKGDLTECNNWRGITQSAVIAKIMGRILINRIRDGTDRKLRKEQPDSEKGKGPRSISSF